METLNNILDWLHILCGCLVGALCGLYVCIKDWCQRRR